MTYFFNYKKKSDFLRQTFDIISILRYLHLPLSIQE
nr:MAG TPA: hypothetical protein [Caudoviricetes sp.]